MNGGLLSLIQYFREQETQRQQAKWAEEDLRQKFANKLPDGSEMTPGSLDEYVKQRQDAIDKAQIAQITKDYSGVGSLPETAGGTTPEGNSFTGFASPGSNPNFRSTFDPAAFAQNKVDAAIAKSKFFGDAIPSENPPVPTADNPAQPSQTTTFGKALASQARSSDIANVTNNNLAKATAIASKFRVDPSVNALGQPIDPNSNQVVDEFKKMRKAGFEPLMAWQYLQKEQKDQLVRQQAPVLRNRLSSQLANNDRKGGAMTILEMQQMGMPIHMELVKWAAPEFGFGELNNGGSNMVYSKDPATGTVVPALTVPKTASPGEILAANKPQKPVAGHYFTGSNGNLWEILPGGQPRDTGAKANMTNSPENKQQSALLNLHKGVVARAEAWLKSQKPTYNENGDPVQPDIKNYHDYQGYLESKKWLDEYAKGGNAPTQQSGDPVGAWITKARTEGHSPEEIKQELRNKGYGSRYDSWVW